MGVSPDDTRIEQIAFAKLLGEGLELYAKKYEIVIGRKSKSSVVDVVLGTLCLVYSRMTFFLTVLFLRLCTRSEVTLIPDEVVLMWNRRYNEHIQAACKNRLQV